MVEVSHKDVKIQLSKNLCTIYRCVFVSFESQR